MCVRNYGHFCQVSCYNLLKNSADKSTYFFNENLFLVYKWNKTFMKILITRQSLKLLRRHIYHLFTECYKEIFELSLKCFHTNLIFSGSTGQYAFIIRALLAT